MSLVLARSRGLRPSSVFTGASCGRRLPVRCRRHTIPGRAKPKLGAVADFIDKVLDEDCQAPRKQRHTARRIHRRILTEFPDAAVAELTVRNHVRERKRQMGLVRRETFVPQSYSWAQEAQVDWYEAWVDFGDERTRVQVFAMRSMASGAAFHRAYLHATQQAFLEAHEHAFAYFGGVFHLLRYDNLASAVRKILRGHRREETVRFLAFRSHWRFAAEFCTPGEGHEKGGIEGEGGYFRRNHLVPVPRRRRPRCVERHAGDGLPCRRGTGAGRAHARRSARRWRPSVASAVLRGRRLRSGRDRVRAWWTSKAA